MSGSLEFEARPMGVAGAAVGEKVSFKDSDERLVALNGNGEVFGRVPDKYAIQLRKPGVQIVDAEVVGRSGKSTTIRVTWADAEDAASDGRDQQGQAAEAGEDGAAGAHLAPRDGSSQDGSGEAESQDGTASSHRRRRSGDGSSRKASEEKVVFEEESYDIDEMDLIDDSKDEESEDGGDAGSDSDKGDVEDSVEQADQGKKTMGRMAVAIIIIAVLIALLVFVTVTALLPSDDSESEETQTLTDGTVTLDVPTSWEVDEDEDGMLLISSDDYLVFMTVYSDSFLDGTATADEVSAQIAESTNSSGGAYMDVETMSETTTDDGVLIRTYDYSYSYEDDEDDGEETEFVGTCELVFSGDSVTVIAEMCDSGSLEDYEETVADVLSSVAASEPSEPDLATSGDDGEE